MEEEEEARVRLLPILAHVYGNGNGNGNGNDGVAIDLEEQHKAFPSLSSSNIVGNAIDFSSSAGSENINYRRTFANSYHSQSYIPDRYKPKPKPISNPMGKNEHSHFPIHSGKTAMLPNSQSISPSSSPFSSLFSTSSKQGASPFQLRLNEWPGVTRQQEEEEEEEAEEEKEQGDRRRGCDPKYYWRKELISSSNSNPDCLPNPYHGNGNGNGNGNGSRKDFQFTREAGLRDIKESGSHGRFEHYPGSVKFEMDAKRKLNQILNLSSLGKIFRIAFGFQKPQPEQFKNVRDGYDFPKKDYKGMHASNDNVYNCYPALWSLFHSSYFFPMGLVIAAIVYEVAGNRIMTVTAGFYQSLTSMDADLFVHTLYLSSVVILCIAFTKEMCIILFRSNLVLYIHRGYFRNGAAHSLILGKRADHDIDNTDHRITLDVGLFCEKAGFVFANSVTTPGLIIYYTWFLYRTFGWTAPVACYIYFVIAIASNTWILSRLIHLVYGQEKLEGYFRYDHAWFRSNVEAISLYGGEYFENIRISEEFEFVIKNKIKITNRQFPLYLCNYTFDYMGAIVNYAAVGAAILWLSKVQNSEPSVLSALVAKGSFSCLTLINAFSTLIDLSKSFGDGMGYASRIIEIIDELEVYNHKSKSDCMPLNEDIARTDQFQVSGNIQWMSDDFAYPLGTELIRIEGLTLTIQGQKRRLLDNLNLTIRSGEHILIQGNSGSGKTSLIKAIAGLWNHSQAGRVKYMKDDLKVMCMPQNTYCFYGTLVEQLTFPTQTRNISGKTKSMIREVYTPLLHDILLQLRLDHLADLVGGLSSIGPWVNRIEWQQILSRGEMQRIGIARVLFQRPHVVFLDESTTGVEFEMRNHIFKLLRDTGITILRTGHDSGGPVYNSTLMLKGNGRWEHQLTGVHGLESSQGLQGLPSSPRDAGTK